MYALTSMVVSLQDACEVTSLLPLCTEPSFGGQQGRVEMMGYEWIQAIEIFMAH